MRKRIINQDSNNLHPLGQNWLDLDSLAEVEITSEDAAHPIESALRPGTGHGWLASQPGEQIIRLLFDEPLRLSHIHLLFYEDRHERTQEFLLRWSASRGESYREIVRQQFNFSPPATIREVEDYELDLEGVTELELRITPEIRGGDARASLRELRLA